MDFGELSTREKQALGALCLSAFCGHFAIMHSAIEELITHQVSLLGAANLPDWEGAGAVLRLNGRGDPMPEDVPAAVPAKLRDSFFRLVDDTVEIGLIDMYGASTDQPRKYLQKAIELLKAHRIPIPAAESVKVQPRPLRDEWGEPVTESVQREVLCRCTALLDCRH